MNRFTSTTPTDIDFFIEKSKNKNTTRSTNTWINIYHLWAKLRGKPQNIEELEPKELDGILQIFFAEIKKRDGTDYEPGSLCAMQAGISRYLVESGYRYSILSEEFRCSRSVLEGLAKVLREKGMGKRPNKAASLTVAEEEILWNCEQLGSHSPLSLVNTMWWLLTQHFGLRGRQEHHAMMITDLAFKKSDLGKIFVTFAEGITKTRQSELHQKHRLEEPKMFENDTDRCPVKLLRLFISKRP